MTKPIERKYNINKNKKENKKNNIITKAPHTPVMLNKDELFNKVKKILSAKEINDPYIFKIIEKLKVLSFENIIIKNSKQIQIKTDENRVKILQYLAKEFDGTYIDRPSHISSVGYVKLNNNVKLIVKPNKKYSAGILNEKIIINKINKLCADGPINIRFIGKNKIFECIGIKNCKETGLYTANRRKADLILQGNKDYPISLKKDNAEIWESADKYIGEKARKIIDELLDKNKIDLILSDKGIYHLKPNVAFLPSVEEKRDLIFGSDILPNGAVIEKSFNIDNIVRINDDGWFEIPVTNIITCLEDVDDHRDVIFLIRNDSSRNSKYIGYPGLRVLAVYKKRLNKNILLYDNVVQ